MSEKEKSEYKVPEKADEATKLAPDSNSVGVNVDEDPPEIKLEEVIDTNPVVWYRNTRALLQGIKSNFLLIFVVPAVTLAHFRESKHIDPIPIFICNMIAIIPLAKIMTVGIDDLAARLGQAYTAVLHALSGNLVELVILGIALNDGKYSIIRSSLLGAVLSNLLLVLGLVFLVGSIRQKETTGTHNVAINAKLFVGTIASVLVLSVLALVTPATFKIAVANQLNQFADNGVICDLQNISHATAIILLILYVSFLVFQLKTHKHELIDMSEASSEEPKFFVLFDLFIIIAALSGVTQCAKFLVQSIEEISDAYELGHSFVGMVLLPLGVMSNFIEHLHAIRDAAEEKVDTAISLILNTSVQVILLATPILVLAGWIMGKPLTLDFTLVEIVMLACSVLIVNFLVADCEANWLEGIMLLASYFIIATVFFYSPNLNQDENASHVVCNNLGRNFNKTAGAE